MSGSLLIPDWTPYAPPPGVRALVTCRDSLAGVSRPPYDQFNLASHVGDDAVAVAANRAQLRQRLPSEPLWLEQVHGTTVATLGRAAQGCRADASVARDVGQVCAVMTADCLPLLFAAENGCVVGAAHAGWRGLAAGVIEATVAALEVPGECLQVWLGPAIGPSAFEVGDEVRAVFCRHDARAASAFISNGTGKWLCDLYALARQRLAVLGVTRVAGGVCCTYGDARRFYSYRRDGVTGRMAALIWRE